MLIVFSYSYLSVEAYFDFCPRNWLKNSKKIYSLFLNDSYGDDFVMIAHELTIIFFFESTSTFFSSFRNL